MGLLEEDSFASQFVDVGCLRAAAGVADVARAHVVGHRGLGAEDRASGGDGGSVAENLYFFPTKYIRVLSPIVEKKYSLARRVR